MTHQEEQIDNNGNLVSQTLIVLIHTPYQPTLWTTISKSLLCVSYADLDFCHCSRGSVLCKQVNRTNGVMYGSSDPK